jgi:DNA-binding HxlR family transcriptional regulator
MCTGGPMERERMGEYGQFCPVAKAAEVLDQRWTLLVVRELVAGSSRFNDLHRGVPRMSRTLLAKRLRTLVNQGLVARHEDDRGPVYELTGAGEELAVVIDVIGQWGIRWMSSLSDEDLDPALLMWDMHRRVALDALPQGRTVLAVVLDGTAPELRDWWLILSPDEVDVCDYDPGFETDVTLQARTETLVRIWRGDLGWDDALRSSSLKLYGHSQLRRQVKSWFLLSPFAGVARPEAR